ncbi:MAG: DUF4276 family protein [Alphaproteobacteria bacterium]|nr:DUF4276 family protein [Alphaproteobacteria bacterium]
MNECRRPVLIVEGDGDQAAVPLLVRRIAADLEFHDFMPAPRPKKAGSIPKLSRIGEIERFVRHAENEPGSDCVLIVLDCDDDCAVQVSKDWANRLNKSKFGRNKPIAIAFIVREYESLFLASAAELALSTPEREWQASQFPPPENAEAMRSAKSALKNCFKVRKYRETIDQAPFTQACNLSTLRLHSRSFRHLESAVKFLYTSKITPTQVYPQAP